MLTLIITAVAHFAADAGWPVFLSLIAFQILTAE